MARTRARLLVAGLTLTLVAGVVPAQLAAASATRAKVPPAEWVSSVCTTLGNWKDALQGAVADEESSLAAARRLHGKAQVHRAKQILQRLLRESVSLTKKAAKELDKAGEPDATNGSEISSILVDGFAKVLAGYERAKRQADALSPSSASAFRKGVRPIETALATLRTKIRTEFSSIRGRDSSGQVAAAIRSEPACGSLGSSSTS